MRRRIATAAACLLWAGVFVIGCGGETNPAKVIPDNAQAAVIIPNLGDTAGHVGDFMDFLAKQVPLLAAFKQQGAAVTGVDFTKAAELAKKGLNPKGGLGIAILDTSKMNAAVLIPVKKEGAFIAFMNELARKQGAPELKKEGDVYRAAGAPGVLKIRKGFAIYAQNTATLDKLTGKGKKLADNDDYKTVIKEVGSSGDLIVYVSGKAVSGAPTPEARKAVKVLEGLKSIGGKLNIAKGELSLRLFMNMSGMGDAEEIFSSDGEGSLLESIPGPAAVLARSNVSVPALWEYMKTKSPPDFRRNFEAAMAQVQVPATVNLEGDLISNIVGNLAFAYYGQSGRGRRAVPDYIVALVVKDEAKVRDSLGKIAASMKSGRKRKKSDLEQMGVIEFGRGRNKFYVAVVKNNLILTPVADRMKKTLAAFAGTGPKAAFALIKNKDVKKALEDKKANVAYLGVEGLVEGLKKKKSKFEIAQIEQYQAQMPGLFKSYMLIGGEVKKNGGILTVTVHLSE